MVKNLLTAGAGLIGSHRIDVFGRRVNAPVNADPMSVQRGSARVDETHTNLDLWSE